MTEEEYLKACGWERGAMSSGKEWWSRHGRRCAFAEAVDLQVAEDLARLAFVQSWGGVSGFTQTGCWVATTGGGGGGGSGSAVVTLGSGGGAYRPAPPPKPAEEWTPISLVFDAASDDSGVPYESLSADPERPDARLVPSSGLIRTAAGRTIKCNPAGWRSVRLDADGSTWWYAKGPALVPIVAKLPATSGVGAKPMLFVGMPR